MEMELLRCADFLFAALPTGLSHKHQRQHYGMAGICDVYGHQQSPRHAAIPCAAHFAVRGATSTHIPTGSSDSDLLDNESQRADGRMAGRKHSLPEPLGFRRRWAGRKPPDRNHGYKREHSGCDDIRDDRHSATLMACRKCRSRLLATPRSRCIGPELFRTHAGGSNSELFQD